MIFVILLSIVNFTVSSVRSLTLNLALTTP